ncbi:Wrn [Symbiodinium sp. CCMP2456]|nr:Wrn [Symbiodinium sp. CCMP2456]
MRAASLGRRGCLVSVRSVAVEVVPPAPKLHVSALEIARLPLLQFPGRILVISSPEEEKRVEELFKGEALLGFDSESRPSSALAQKNRMALIQIASEKVACLWRLGELRSLPPLLRRLLEDRDVHKVSQGAVHELSALKEQWGINPQSFLDLHHIAMHLRTTPRSLQGLVAIFLQRRLSKDQRLTDWQQSPLTQAQIEYAAIDAWAARQVPAMAAYRSGFILIQNSSNMAFFHSEGIFGSQIHPAMDSDIEAPPSPDPTPPSPRSGDWFQRLLNLLAAFLLTRRNSCASIQSTGEGSTNFVEVLAQIQALQEKLLHIYEADVEGMTTQSKKVLRPMKSFSKQLSVMDATKSATLLNEYHDSLARAASPQDDMPETLPAGPKAGSASSLAKSAHDVTAASMEETLRLGEQAFQVGVEWAMEESELADLQRSNAFIAPRQTTTTSGAARKLRTATERPAQGCAISPESPKRMLWDILSMVALLVEVLTAPLQVYDISGEVRQVGDVLHWSTTSYWVLDVPASFLTAVYINDILHTKLADVARVYLRSWFLFDMLMLAPEAVFFASVLAQQPGEESEDPAASGLLRALRARRLVRVVRFVRILRFQKAMVVLKKLSCYRHFRLFFQGRISSSLLPVLCLMFGLAAAVHFLASLWFVAGTVEHGWAFDEGLHEAPFALQYIRSVEWAVSRLPASSLRANVELHTAFERWLAILATFASLIISSMFVSILTNLMADVARRTRKMAQILESVRKYCGTCGVSYAHTMKVRRLVEREHCRASIQDHMQFLLTLPEALVKELFHEARSITLACHPFFMEIGAMNPTMELQLCNKAAKELYLLEHDEMFRGNEKGEGIYILASGAAQYAQGAEFYLPLTGDRDKARQSASPNIALRFFNVVAGTSDRLGEKNEGRRRSESKPSKPPVDVSADDYLSEQALWIRGWKHQGRLAAIVESRALHLATVEVRSVLNDYSDVLAVAVVYARSYVETMNRLSAEEVSDLPLDPSQFEMDPAWSVKVASEMRRDNRLDRVEPEPLD